MVRTKQGQIGWVRALDVMVSSHVKDSFKEKESGSSSWGAVTEDGKAFGGKRRLYRRSELDGVAQHAAFGRCAMPAAQPRCAAPGRRRCIAPAGTAPGAPRSKAVAAISMAVGPPSRRVRARCAFPTCSRWPPRKRSMAYGPAPISPAAGRSRPSSSSLTFHRRSVKTSGLCESLLKIPAVPC